MLTPCKSKMWFVVELCEPIQPSAIELANFELYSSTPKEIQIQGSDKYPTQEWLPLGSFEASESRELQRFDIKSQSDYMKFIRVSLHSYYGSEHYCPVSLIRAFGISLAEEFDTIENGAPSSIPVQHPPPDQVVSNESVNGMGSGTMTTDVPLSELIDKASGPDEVAAMPPHQVSSPVHGCQETDILLGESIENSCQASSQVSDSPAPASSPTPAAPGLDTYESILSPTPVLLEVAEINSKITSTFNAADMLVSAPEQTSLPADTELIKSQDVSASGSIANVLPTEQVTILAPAVAPSPPESAASLASEVPASTTPPAPPASAPPPPPSPPVLQGPAHVMNESSTGSVIAASSSKESIFIRLNNRIKALELNMTLNREAIESLIRKQDMFEYRMNELMNRTHAKEEEGQRLVIDLQMKLNDISEQVYLLVAEKEVFHWQLIQVHILLMVIEIAVIIMIMSSFMKKMMPSAPAATTTALSCQQALVSRPPAALLTPSKPVFKLRATPEKNSILVEHHPITGTTLFKKKRKKKRKNRGLPTGDQENLPPPPPSPSPVHHHPDLQPQQLPMSAERLLTSTE